jgi:hypothetical protein
MPVLASQWVTQRSFSVYAEANSNEVRIIV